MALVDIFGSATFREDQDRWVRNAPRREGLIRQPIIGYNTVITTEEYIWPEGGTYVWTTISAPVELSSSDANDTAAGTGMRTVIVYGLDINLLPIAETVTLSGVTPVATVLSFFRVNHLVGASCGTYSGSNLGKISCIQQTSSVLMSTIPIDDAFSQQAIFTVPAGYHGFIHGISLQASSTKSSVDFSGVARQGPAVVGAPFIPHLHLGRWFDIMGTAIFIYEAARYVPGGTDIWMLGTKNATGNDPGASVEVDILMYPVDARRF